jgi:hypothetical protein
MLRRFFLFLPDDTQYLREKYRYDRHKYEERDFSPCIEKYRSNTKKCRQSIDNTSYRSTTKSELHESIMEMMRLVSAHRILSLQYPNRHDIDEIDKVDAEHRHRCSYLPSCDDSECRDEKSEHDRTRVSHDTTSTHIEPREEECRGYDDGKDDEEKLTIFLAR